MKKKIVPQLWISMFFCAFLCASCNSNNEREYLDLSGEWKYTLEQESSDFNKTIVLPSTLDDINEGKPNEYNHESRFLSKKYIHEGKAWYQKEINIPADWENQQIELFLERTRQTSVWIDDVKVGDNSTI